MRYPSTFRVVAKVRFQSRTSHRIFFTYPVCGHIAAQSSDSDDASVGIDVHSAASHELVVHDDSSASPRAGSLPGGSSFAPIVELSHATWESLCVRMSAASFDKRAPLWWSALTPGAVEHWLRLNRDKKATESSRSEGAGAVIAAVPKVAGQSGAASLTHLICPLLVVHDELAFPRALPSLLAALPCDHLLSTLPADLDADAGLSVSGSGASGPLVGDPDDLCVRAALIVSSIEFSPSEADIPVSQESLKRVTVVQQAADAAAAEAAILLDKADAELELKRSKVGLPIHASSAVGSGPTAASHETERVIARLYAKFLMAAWPTAWMSPSRFLSLRRCVHWLDFVLLSFFLLNFTPTFELASY
jgi:hypothetical protein